MGRPLRATTATLAASISAPGSFLAENGLVTDG